MTGSKFAILGLIIGLAFAPAANAASRSAPVETAAKLQAFIVEHRKATADVPGEALYVQTPGWTWQGATGAADAAGTPLTTRHVFRIASVTKAYTAAAVLRLMEQHKLTLSDPIERYISPASAAQLRAGGYKLDQITIQQLLAHTSGIYDYAMDPGYAEKGFADIHHQWTRAEQVQWAMDKGKPYGEPGTVYVYSDTGYVLLGEIIERITGQNLAAAVRDLLHFKRLGLKTTYWEQLEPAPKGLNFAGNWFGKLDLTTSNPSMDLYGGGGLVSDTREMAVFYRALLRGEIFDNRSTLTVLMTAPILKAPKGGDRIHNNAVYLIQVGPHLCQGHGGFWGQLVVYCPEQDTTFAWTMNQGQHQGMDLQKVLNGVAASLGWEPSAQPYR
jgi:D-alanyl-D-alanine carboxypeptidase